MSPSRNMRVNSMCPWTATEGSYWADLSKKARAQQMPLETIGPDKETSVVVQDRTRVHCKVLHWPEDLGDGPVLQQQVTCCWQGGLWSGLNDHASAVSDIITCHQSSFAKDEKCNANVYCKVQSLAMAEEGLSGELRLPTARVPARTVAKVQKFLASSFAGIIDACYSFGHSIVTVNAVYNSTLSIRSPVRSPGNTGFPHQKFHFTILTNKKTTLIFVFCAVDLPNFHVHPVSFCSEYLYLSALAAFTSFSLIIDGG